MEQEERLAKVIGVILGVSFVVLFGVIKAHATQVTIPTTWQNGDTVTDTKLNNINNAFANVINGGLDSVNMASGYSLIHSVSTLPSAGTQGAVDFLTSDNSLNIDNGAAWLKAITPADTLATGQIPLYNSGWHQLAPGAQYLPIVSNGSSSLPSYQVLSTHGGGTSSDLSAAAQGAVPYFSATGTMSALATGNSGQFLKTQGASANPIWADVPQDVNTSNTLFQYQGQVDQQGSTLGEVVGTTLNPNGATGNYRFLQMSGGSLVQIWTAKFIKVAGISTVTVYARIWNRLGSGSPQANFSLDIGGVHSSAKGTVNRNTPEWITFTIDVSSLTNGTAYDVTASLDDTGAAGTSYCSNIMGFGS